MWPIPRSYSSHLLKSGTKRAPVSKTYVGLETIDTGKFADKSGCRVPILKVHPYAVTCLGRNSLAIEGTCVRQGVD